MPFLSDKNKQRLSSFFEIIQKGAKWGINGFVIGIALTGGYLYLTKPSDKSFYLSVNELRPEYVTDPIRRTVHHMYWNTCYIDIKDFAFFKTAVIGHYGGEYHLYIGLLQNWIFWDAA